MSAAEILAELTRRGVRLSAEGERLTYDAPEGVMQPADFEQLKTHKTELLKALANDASAGAEEQLIDAKVPDNEAEAMLRKHPNLTHAFVPIETDDPDYEHVVVAIRDKATCVLRIPREKYDGLAVLEWIEQHVNKPCERHKN
jgi:TubC N-terminal docking domain